MPITNNSINTPLITLGGAFTMSGAFTFVGTLTGNTTVTFPTTGTLLSSASYPVPGATAGKIIISDGATWISSTSIWPNTVGTTGHILISNGTSNVYSTPAYPNASATAGKVVISDGTDYVASTSIWPNTVGTALHVVLSNGTSNVYSTPAYPNASVTAGKLIISDGTNYIASTSIWPNTVGASGKLVISDGTSNVYSTPTYPNASATSGKIIISDGTNFIASTSLWPNTVGTALKMVASNGTSNAYTTSTYADTYAINTILYNASANTVTGLATANSGVLVTSAGGVPSISSTLPAFTTSSITFSPTTGGIVGTTTNDNAAAGKVGEYVESIIAVASAVSLSDSAAANVTSISLTAGDWDVFGNVYFIIGGTCTLNYAWTSSTSATVPDASLINAFQNNTTGTSLKNQGIGTPYKRYSLSGTTTVYLSAYAAFSTSTVTACGGIYARRVR